MFEPKPAEDFIFKESLYAKQGWVARITLNRPHVNLACDLAEPLVSG